ncbi:MAG: WG repeat-containing protein [Clostridia bacterium]|nr:WG repeat-containing protein [Clostridia bacterium]
MSEENKNFSEESNQDPVEKEVISVAESAKSVNSVMNLIRNLDKKTIAIIGGVIAAVAVVAISLVFIIGGGDSPSDSNNDGESGSLIGDSDDNDSEGGDGNDNNGDSDNNASEGGDGNDNNGDSDDNASESGDGNDNNPEVNEAQVYKEYNNLKRIDSYHNGLATFMIYNSSSVSHWGSNGSWTGTYLYGFIDVNGNVVIDPVYECSPHVELPKFEHNYIKVGDLDDHEYIIDKSGNIIFEAGKNGVSAIGKVSEDYFWVETYTEELAGNVYVVKYYSAFDLSVVATFENIRAVPDHRTIGGKNSAITATGEGLLVYDLNKYGYYDKDMFFFNIADYDTNFAPKVDTWSVDINKIEAFASISRKYYNVSGTDNTNGQFAAVALLNESNIWFYSIVDSNGNVVLQPQRDIAFPYSGGANGMITYEFCKDLCPAQDATSGYWGYVSPDGEWKIMPQFYSATPFSSDGYATVNEKIVIDTEGNVVLSPAGWVNDIVTSLNGIYVTRINSYSYYLTFSEDGKVTIEEKTSGFSSKREGNYRLLGSNLTITEMGAFYGSPFGGDGVYSFRKEGNTIYLNDTAWTLTE